MLWKFEGSMPVYLQIMDHIRRSVLMGEYPPGSRIPPVRELAASANVNPNTMQRALVALEEEKLLLAVGTSGRFVTSDAQVLEDMRKVQIDRLIRASARKYREMGLSLQEAAQMLLALEEEKEEA